MPKAPEPFGLDGDTLNMYRDVREKHERGEDVDAETLEALKAVELAGQIMNSIMSGGQVDPVFLKKMAEIAEGKLTVTEAVRPKKVKKRKRFKKVAK